MLIIATTLTLFWTRSRALALDQILHPLLLATLHLHTQ
eukprot:COSAG02_NODE_396_length_23126_cov_282.150258_8_plen_38_part_00